jgi:uncharacterized membrane protein
MLELLIFIATILAALGAGLLAGNFFAFSAYLMTALGRLSAERGIVAMQAITAAVMKPIFLTLFFGTAALSAVLLCVAIISWPSPGTAFLLTGALVFLAGTFPVTMMRNVPLNNELKRAVPDNQEGRDLWRRFKASWGAWNHVRAVTSLVACALFILALVQAGNPFTRHG